jgi:hypothetical protein
LLALGHDSRPHYPSSESLADLVDKKLAGNDQLIDAVEAILVVGNIVGGSVDDEHVQRPEYALQGVHGRFQITEVGSVDADLWTFLGAHAASPLPETEHVGSCPLTGHFEDMTMATRMNP